ncbi:unnamed protein product [Rotaria sp. Silwood2]|nr:unnamed protein product [Rotaria sp. Silwood2]
MDLNMCYFLFLYRYCTEIREWHEGFIRDCPNGRLDKKKFVQIYQQFYPTGKADNYCKYAFSTFDTNNDGKIDFQEFLIAIAATSQGDLDDRLTAVFEMYDFSHNGVIDQTELTVLITAMYDLLGETDRKDDHDPKKLAADIITHLDVDGDKKLSKAEFITGYAFSTFDTNNDGTIDFEEFLIAITATSQGDLDDRLSAVFNMYDISHDGLVDKKELIALITAMYDLLGETDRKGDHDPKKIAVDIIEKFDTSHDKKLNKEEFITGCKTNGAIRLAIIFAIVVIHLKFCQKSTSCAHTGFQRYEPLVQDENALPKMERHNGRKVLRSNHVIDCPNGRLDKKQFIQIYQQFYPKGKADNYCKYAFSTFDTNNDGTIDFEEFLIAIATTSQGDLDARLSAVFDLYDFSRDGLIDQKELTTLIKSMLDLLGETNRKTDCDPKTLAAGIIARLDVNGDKKLKLALLKANTKYSEKGTHVYNLFYIILIFHAYLFCFNIEIRQWHTGFIRDCPTGKLDKKKFVEVYKQFYPQGKPENFCKYAFDTFDTNNDGSINFEEFLLAISATSQGDLDDRLAVAFDMYDISDDGLIDQAELTKLITAMYDLVGESNRKGDNDPKKRAGEIIAKLDVSGDKKLTKAECKGDPVIRKLLAPNA